MADLSDQDDLSSSATLKFQNKKLEREEVQKRTFLRWINSQLSRAGKKTISADNFVEEIKDGTLLLALIQILTGIYVKPEMGVMRVHHLNNVDQAIRFLEKQYNIKLVNICSDDIVNGNIKLILGLLWTLILHWQVNDVLKVSISDKPQSNLEKTLLEWCRASTKGYSKVNIANFSSSFSDGMVFCALLHYYAPYDFIYEDLINLTPLIRLKFAFDFAENKFGIEKILDPDDVFVDQPDKKSILIYIICCYQILNQRIPKKHLSTRDTDEATASKMMFHGSPEKNTENLGNWEGTESKHESSVGEERHLFGGRKIEDKELNTAPINIVENFQSSMESVLVWLLEAKETINSLPGISDDVQIVKEQFQDHEDFMVKLTERQTDIGLMMQRGNDLLTDNSITKTQQKQVEAQMLLLNKEWEELRVRAMTRQSRLQSALTNLQQQQLNNLETWLIKMETIISDNSKKNNHCENIQEELKLHKMLQDEVESQQHQVNGLQNMVVVVDENNSDESTYSALEKQLEDLGQRWGQVCRWVESRWVTLQNVLQKLKNFDAKKERFSDWITTANANLDSCADDINNMDSVAKHVKLLKALELDVDAYMLQFDELNIIGSELELNLINDQSAITDINDQLQSLKTKWDSTMSRMEENSKKIVDSGVIIEELRQLDGTILLTIKKNGIADVKTVTVTNQILTAANTTATANNINQFINTTNFNATKTTIELPVHATKIATTTIGNATVNTTTVATNNISFSVIDNSINLSSINVPASNRYTTASTSNEAGTSTHAITINTTTTNSATVTAYPKEVVLPVTSKEKLEFLAGYMAVDSIQTSDSVTKEGNTEVLMHEDKLAGNVTRLLAENVVPINEDKVAGPEVKITKNIATLPWESVAVVDEGKILTALPETPAYLVEKAREIGNSNIWEEKTKVVKTEVEIPGKDIVDNAPIKSGKVVLLDQEKHKKWQLSLDELRSFLRSVRTDLPQDQIMEYADISRKRINFKNYKSKLDQKSPVFNDIVNYSNEHAIDQSDESKYKIVKADWLKSTEEAELEIQKMDELLASINRFNVLLREESRWQEQMERILNRRFKPSGDAEDLAEELDEFENRISDLKSSNRDKLEAICRSVSLHGPIGGSMDSNLVEMGKKTDNILQQARTRMARLEEGITAAQQREGQIVEMQQWMLDVHDTLQHHLDADLLAGDLPEEFQILSDEFSHQEDFLGGLEADAMRFRRDGMDDAAERLQQQITLLKRQFDDVKFKFTKFQKPTDFDSKFNFVKRELDEIDESIQLMEMGGSDVTEIQNQFDSYIKFYKRMSELKGNVEEVIRMGRQVAERKQVEFPQMLNSQIDAIKGQYNRLGSQVTNGKITLEKCLRLSRKIHKETRSLNEFSDQVEDELNKNIPLKQTWIETSLMEASNRKSILKMLNDAVDQWLKLSETNGLKKPNTSIVNDTSVRLNKIVERLHEATRNQPIDPSNSAVIQHSAVNQQQSTVNDATAKKKLEKCKSEINEIEQWIISMEDEFDNVASDDKDKIEDMIRSIDARRVQFDSVVHLVRTSEDTQLVQIMTPRLIQLTRRFHLLSRRQQLLPSHKENLPLSPVGVQSVELRVQTPLEKSVFTDTVATEEGVKKSSEQATNFETKYKSEKSTSNLGNPNTANRIVDASLESRIKQTPKYIGVKGQDNQLGFIVRDDQSPAYKNNDVDNGNIALGNEESVIYSQVQKGGNLCTVDKKNGNTGEGNLDGSRVGQKDLKRDILLIKKKKVPTATLR